MKKQVKVRSLGLLLLAFFIPAPAFAGYLTITGHATIQVTLEEGMVHLSGEYIIGNQGDEVAQNVFPRFSLGSWSWVGSPQEVGPGREYQWDLDERIPLSSFRCKRANLCAGLTLPDEGIYPMLVYRHYRDVNGYRFSAPELIPLTIGKVVDEDDSAMALQPQLRVSGDGEQFELQITIVNSDTEPREVRVSAFTSKEIQLESKPKRVQVPAMGQVSTTIGLKNLSGLLGSSYAVYGLLEWEDGGGRMFSYAAEQLKIAKPPKSSFYLLSICAVSIVLVCLLYFSVFRSKKSVA